MNDKNAVPAGKAGFFLVRFLLETVFSILGAFVGYALSYMFQSEFIRQKLSLSGYIEHALDILFPGSSSQLPSDVTITAWVCVAIVSIIFSIAFNQVWKKAKK